MRRTINIWSFAMVALASEDVMKDIGFIGDHRAPLPFAIVVTALFVVISAITW